LVDEPFEDREWLYEIKWDGYRAICFVENGKARLVSRNQNDLTADFPDLAREIPPTVSGKQFILDGEVVALDERGRSSFSLMQQRTGFTHPGRRTGGDPAVPIVYYVFDLLYLDGYSLMRVDLEPRKQLLQQVLAPTHRVRYSDHYLDHGLALYELARENGLEGIIAKRRRSCYLQKRTREWLKLKITQMQECVIAGYTDPRGSRENFGSVVLGLYDKRGRLMHVGQAGSGFTHKTHADMWKLLKARQVSRSPFANKVDSTRKVHYVRPELVAEIKFSEWTHEGEGGGFKMRAPVFQGLRKDKKPEECVFEFPQHTRTEVEKAESGEAA
jgi:bifunctional non-homologous end joining protein LigD